MIFKSIHLKEGMFERMIDFTQSANLVYSKENSCGKTTLLRFMLYGLGYNIPNTRKIKFDQCEVEIRIESEVSGVMRLARYDSNFIELSMNSSGEMQTFVLPEQQHELHRLIWGTENSDILDNLLGAYYVDQEKGWTLLNRGVVIGSIRFNIEELIRGLSGTDCSELIDKEEKITRELGKYRQMFSVALYRETLENDIKNLVPDSYENEIDTAMDSLLIEQRKIKSELRRIDSTLSDNRKLKKFISDMKLLVQAPDGSTFPVTDQNIVGLNDSIDLLISKRKMVAAQFAKVSSKIEHLQQERIKENEKQISFIDTETQIETFDKRISRLPLNPVSIKRELDRLKNEAKTIREEISRITKTNNKVASTISENIIKYATELGIGDKDSIPVSYLFTSNLKELSGAILHKTAFAFRLAYIVAIESVLKIKLPIILDSPRGKEVDPQNVKLMMDLLKRDFSDHQIIIASIYSYDFPSLNTIEIRERLIEIQ